MTMRTWSALLLCLTLCACATPPETPVTPPATLATSPSLDTLITRVARLRNLPPDQQQAEYNAVERAYLTQPSGMHRVLLALFLSEPNVPFRDDARAFELLRAAPERYENEPLGRLVMFWLQHLEERLVTKEACDAIKLTLEQHTQLLSVNAQELSAVRKSCAGLRQDLHRESELRRGLEHKLEELKAIETMINRRNGTTP